MLARGRAALRCAAGCGGGDAFDEIEGGQQQVFLGIASHRQQVTIAQVAVDERQQIALRMIVDASLGGLPHELVTQAFAEPDPAIEALQTALLDVLRDEGPVQPRRLDRLLYTSDAADDLLCVDLGGCRIIKPKTYTTIVHQPTHS